MKPESFSASRSFMDRQQASSTAEELPPLIYRVFKSTVQRQLVDIKSLNSNAAFIFIQDEKRQVLLWIGKDCDETDTDVVRELAKDILTRDYGMDRADQSCIRILKEINDQIDHLNTDWEDMFRMLNSNVDLYFLRTTVNERRLPLENNAISVGVIEPLFENPSDELELTSFELQETSFAHPDHQTGTVPRVAFPNVEINTVAYVQIGEQWDLWIARGADTAIVEAMVEHLKSIIEAQLIDVVADFNPDMVKNYFQIVHQGEERVCFRRPLKIFTDFEPPGKTLPRPHQDSGIKSAVDRRLVEKNISRHMQSFFNDVRLESSSFDEEGDMPKSQSMSFYGGRSMSLHSHSQSMINVPAAVHFIDVKTFIDKDANCAFPSKQAEGEKEKMNVFFAEQPLPEIRRGETGHIGEDAFKLIDSKNINPKERKTLLEKSSSQPEVMLGWQVEIDHGLYSGIHVIIDIKKTLFRKTLFLLFDQKEKFWIKLQRGGSKKGVKFRPLRKVFVVEEGEIPQPVVLHDSIENDPHLVLSNDELELHNEME